MLCGEHKFGVAFIGLMVMRFSSAALISSGEWVERDSWLQVAAVGTKKIGVFQVIGRK